MIIQTTPLEQEIALNFVARRLNQNGSTEKYIARGSNKISKIGDDIYSGAVSEIAVYNAFRRRLTSGGISMPDFNIYNVRSKSFDGDLILSDGSNIHVKSVQRENLTQRKHGASWVFQTEDNIFKNYSPYDLVVVCITDQTQVEITGVYRVKDIAENDLLTDLELEKYRGIKVALYAKDLKDITNYIKIIS